MIDLFKAPQRVDGFVAANPSLKAIADVPTAVWLVGGTAAELTTRVKKLVADAAGKTLLLVAYNIPNRDLGSYSAGGVNGPDAYYSWIGALGAAIGSAPAIVVLEPDALGHLHEMQEPAKGQRLTMLKVAADILKKQPGVKVYADLSMGKDANLSAQSLVWGDLKSSIDGFTVNVSGYKTLAACQAWADQVTQITGLPYIVDTSRNGKGEHPTLTGDAAWCNPPGRGLGLTPRMLGVKNMALWIKAPGESDGNLGGAPAAGEFYLERALELVANRDTTPVDGGTTTPPVTPPVTPPTGQTLDQKLSALLASGDQSFDALAGVLDGILALVPDIKALATAAPVTPPVTPPASSGADALLGQVKAAILADGDTYRVVQKLKQLLSI